MDISTRLEWYEDKVTREVERAAGRGIGAAAKFLASRIEEAISVQAPTEMVMTSRGPRPRATTRATPGAPPRAVSGALKRSTGWELVVERMALARVGVFSGQVDPDISETGRPPWQYGYAHETTNHPFVMVTLDKHRSELERIIGGEVVTGRT